MIPAAPVNANRDTSADDLASALDTHSLLETEDLSEKIDLIVNAAVGGLTAKKKYWLEKL